MKRSLFHVLTGAILVLGFSVAAPTWAQAPETIVCPDNAALCLTLQAQTIFGLSPSLGPSDSGTGKSASLSANSVTFNSGTVHFLLGAISNDSDAVTLNSVFIHGGAVQNEAYGGLVSLSPGSGSASNNSVTVDGATAAVNGVTGGKVWGAVGDATVLNNSVDVRNGAAGFANGGAAHSSGGDATTSGNTVTISDDGVVANHIAGGEAISEAGTATASSNHIIIHDGGEVITSNPAVLANVYGGFADGFVIASLASDNTVTIGDQSTADAEIFGGHAHSEDDSTATASGNSVIVEGGGTATGGDIYGGYASNNDAATATASGNSVGISTGGTADNDVIGGHARANDGAATASNNAVTINGGEVGGEVFGGQAETSGDGAATVSGSTVEISDGGTVGEVVFGARAISASSAAVTGSTITISDGTVAFLVSGGFAEGGENATVSGSSVTISDSMVGAGAVSGSVIGGVAMSDDGIAAVSDNRVEVSGSTVNDGPVFGGAARSDEGTATASNNSAEIGDGTVVRAVMGGGAGSDDFGTTTASGNTVIISGGTVEELIIGGSALSDSGAATATDNTVTIRGAPTFGAGAELYGGRANEGLGTSTGNVLNFHSINRTVAVLADFQRLNFHLPQGLASGGTMLNVTDEADIRGVTAVAAALDSAGGLTVQAGDWFILLNANTLTGAISPMTGTIGGLPYRIAIENGNQIVLRVNAHSSTTATPVPTTGSGVLIVLSLLLAGLAVVRIRNQRAGIRNQ